MPVKSCKNCGQNFEITDDDLAFYEKIKVPKPTFCPPCRDQRRLVQINQLNLYKRKCDATGKDIISHYPPDSPYKVYDQKYWYSDAYDGCNYAKEFDFNHPFFEQFHELSRAVPRPALYTDFLHDENSKYTNYAGRNKNCYLIFDSDENWDCYYSYGINNSKNCADCYRVQKLELCYEVIDSNNCYNCSFIENSENCYDSVFLRNCISCRNCVMCSNLRQKEYHILNKPVSKEIYKEFKNNLKSYKFLSEKIEEFNKFKLQFPQKYMRGVQNENCTGNYLVNCKNARFCFDCRDLWDGKYCTQIFMKAKDCMDADECGECELVYESSEVGYNAYNIRFSLQCLNQIRDLTYCDTCFYSSDLFGCVGLKRKKYCILNKEYTREEYEELVRRIIKHMEGTGEWGEFFPALISPFPYNLTKGQEHYPLTKEEAVKKGYKWYDKPSMSIRAADLPFQKRNIPDSIKDTHDSITNEILSCQSCQKSYKIIPQELKCYRQMEIPIPRSCPDCRHKARMQQRNPRKLFNRTCSKCSAKIQTTYDKNRPEIIYCEKCYLAEVM